MRRFHALTAALLALLVGFGLGGCTSRPTTTVNPPEPASTGPRLGEVRTVLERLARAAQAGDRSGFDQLTSDRDPSFADRTRLLYSNLTALPLASLRFEPDPRVVQPAPARRSVLGEGAWVHATTVTWQLAGEDGTAEHMVYLTFVRDAGRVKLAGTVDEPAGAGRRTLPSWWLGPVEARQTGGATVIAGAGQPAQEWAELTAAALSVVQQGLPRNLAAAWNGRVVLQAPATVRDFEAVLGKEPGSYAGIGAVAHLEGTSAPAVIRVVVNPHALALPPDRRRVLLQHEIVHVATRSPESAAPTWADEGLAEWVAGRANPDVPVDGAADLSELVSREGAPDALPTEADFAPDAEHLRRAYAASWLACRYVAEHFSPAQLGLLYAALSDGASLDEASRDTLGIAETALVEGWRTFVGQVAEDAARSTPAQER